MNAAVVSIKPSNNQNTFSFSSQGERLQPYATQPVQRSSHWHNRASSITRQATTLLAAFRSARPIVTGIRSNGTRSTQDVQAMHRGGIWEFFSNGQFRFTPSGLGTVTRTDLYPIVGNFSQPGGSVDFSGSRGSSDLTSRNFAAISGNLFGNNGEVKANIVQRTVLIKASRVNGNNFGSTSDRSIALSMTMIRIS
jgi:hypothetical protein